MIKFIVAKFKSYLNWEKKRIVKSYIWSSYKFYRKNRYDTTETILLIQKFNSKLKLSNQIGEAIAFLLNEKHSEMQPRFISPQTSLAPVASLFFLLNLSSEWFRCRMVNKTPNYFRKIDQLTKKLVKEWEMVENGKGGLKELKQQIDKLRKERHHRH